MKNVDLNLLQVAGHCEIKTSLCIFIYIFILTYAQSSKLRVCKFISNKLLRATRMTAPNVHGLPSAT
jgi:hypothetical protein